MAKKAAAKKVAPETTAKSGGPAKGASGNSANLTTADRNFDARPDLVDFRDDMFVPTLIEVPQERPLKEYLKVGVPVLDQGQEGACTGFGLATVAHYLLLTRTTHPDTGPVSPRMLYEMARRYDEWEGENYSGSSARGAMKGWHKHGVCSEKKWPYVFNQPAGILTQDRAADAAARPLGAYFRVNHKDLTAMHCALAEVGILSATGMVHTGWDNLQTGSVVAYDGTQKIRGGHAFALVGYDEDGFWFQNSWGTSWGKNGFAKLTYDDWLANGTDVWVARLGVPVKLRSGRGVAAVNSDLGGSSTLSAFSQIRPHIISLGNEGRLKNTGTYATDVEDVRQIVEVDIKNQVADWPKKQLLLYAPGGLTSEESAIQRAANYREPLLDKNIYPLVFSWNSDYWSTVKNILQDALRSRTSGGIIDAAKNFLLDRLDDALEPIARNFTGKAAWDEMKENALDATLAEDGGLRLTATSIDALCTAVPKLELHLAGHSAGSIVLAYLTQLLTAEGTIEEGPLEGVAGFGRKIKTCTLWAPACTVDLFVNTYGPCLENGQIEKMRLFVLRDAVEQDDNCGNIYNKSLLYLVAHAFEDLPRDRRDRPFGVPLLGMARTLDFDATDLRLLSPRDKKAVQKLQELIANGQVEVIRSPNSESPSDGIASTSQHHGDFDDDEPTFHSLVATITQRATAPAGAGPAAEVAPADTPRTKDEIIFQRSAQSCASQRFRLEQNL